MNSFIAWFQAWRKQPTTIMCFAVVVGAAVYWKTQNLSAAGIAAGFVAGGLNDNTKALLAKTEALEDGMRAVLGNTTVTANVVTGNAAMAQAMSSRFRTGLAAQTADQAAPSSERLVPRT